MPSSYTTSLRLTLPATGELAGQWGNTVNTGITELLDAAVAGTASISTWGGAGVAYTLSNNSGTADEARKMFIVATGTPGEAKNVICPAVSKFYVFRNDTTGGFALTLKTPSGTGIAVPAGQYKFLYCDGTNVVEMFNSAGALTLSGALSVGGTTTLASNPTLSAGTANQVQYLNASKVLTGSANLTFDGTTLTAANFADSSLTATRVTYAGASGNLTDSANLTFNGTDLTVSGAVNAGTVNATTLDLTNIEVTNIKAKDGTASMTLADATGVASFSANPTLSAGTAQGVLYLNGSKVATSGSALTFDGTKFSITGTQSANLLSVNASGGGDQFSATALAAGSGAAVASLNSASSDYEPLRIIAEYQQFDIRSGVGTSSEQMRLTSTGLGIGTSSPGSYNAAARNLVLAGSSSYVGMTLKTAGGVANIVFSNAEDTGVDGLIQYDTTSNYLRFDTNGAETIRITSGGDLLVGTTSGAERLVVSGTTNNYVIKSIAPSTSGTYYHILFDDAGTSHGSITSNGTNTAYNTTSDYRLKDNPQPLTGSGAFIDALQPKTWEWKTDGSRGVGFIAHEVQAVSPSSVVGQKDAVDADGKPVMQAMEYGSAEFIANIIAELQSLRARVAALEAQP